MRKSLLVLFSVLICIQLIGCAKCTVRTSTSRQPRVDQEVSGNRGFISGEPSSPPKQPSFKDRKVYKIEVEIPPLELKKREEKKELPVSAVKEDKEDQVIWGNRGYLVGEPQKTSIEEEDTAQRPQKESPIVKIKEKISQVLKTKETPEQRTYTTRKGDTLQKISRRFYGTTKKWPLLYKTNKDNLKNPDKIYPGQVLIIPEVGQYKK